MTTSMVELVNIEKRFKDFVAAKDINLKVKSGEFLTLLGPSGCGKTTTLRMIAGFEQPSEGEVWIDGKQVDSIEPYKRDVNTVFQSYALFPHMNIYDNIAFGLKMKKVKKDEIKQRVKDILKLVQLEQFAERKPDQLSGGQKQRVAIARALVNNPKVLLLDEPLGALDLRLRKQMQVELKHLQKRLGITFIYVTHDQEEALTMSDRIIVMNQGLIEQIGSPSDIYERPRTRFIADFIGETNIFEGEYLRKEGDYVYISVEGSEVMCHCPGEDIPVNGTVYVAVRPENMDLTAELKENVSLLNCVFKEKIYIGSVTKLVMELPSGESIIVNETDENRELIEKGEKVQVCWKAKDSVLLTS